MMQIVDRLSSHLKEELRVLSDLLVSVRKVHSALRRLDDVELASALEQETESLRQSERIQHQRRQLRMEFGLQLGLSHDQVTFRKLVSLVDVTVRGPLEEIRKSLVEMSQEMERINRQNSAMLRQSESIAEGIIGRLTGIMPGSEPYNSGGVREETRVKSLVQWGA